jgi:threonine dehydratase
MLVTPATAASDSAAADISRATIEAAATRIAPFIIETPLVESPRLNDKLGIRLLVKAECLQHTGSFKLRGASNAVWSLDDTVKHVVAFSSGNHAQGVARAAASRGLQATIVMPKDSPAGKIEGTKAYGATVILYDRYTESREDIGADLATRKQAHLIKPFDDVRVIAGQGTVGLEIATQAAAKNLTPDAIICCCGGGGLIAGMSIAASDMIPGVDIWAAEPKFYDDTRRSLASGKIETADITMPSICDSIVTAQPGEITFPINKKLLSGSAVITDRDALQAVATAFKHLKIIIEPGGAAALAAVLTGQYPSGAKTVVVVASGGNIDTPMFQRALDQGPLF